MPITLEQFESRLLEFVQQHDFSNVEEFLDQCKIYHLYELFIDDTINAYLRRPVEIINNIPQLSQYEKKLYSFEQIPFRHAFEEEDLFASGLDQLLSDISVFSGKFGKSAQEGRGVSDYDNIHFLGKTDNRESELQSYLQKAYNAADENLQPQYYTGDVGFGDHFSVIVFTVQQKTIKCAWVDSRDFYPNSNILSMLKGRISRDIGDNIELKYISLDLQNQPGDNNCALYGLNVIKALARIGLQNLPVTREAIIGELPMYYDNGIQRDYEIIKAYHLRTKWEIGNNHLEDLSRGNIPYELAKCFLESGAPSLAKICSAGLEINEAQEMAKFIFESIEEEKDQQDIPEVVGDVPDSGYVQ